VLPLNEAAELVGLTEKALARRAERGTLRVVLREGKRHVPRSELERTGLLDPAGNPTHAPLGEGSPVLNPAGLSALLGRLEALAGENATLRQLERQTGTLAAQVETERRAREAAEEQLHNARAAAREFEQIAAAGFFERRRLLRARRER